MKKLAAMVALFMAWTAGQADALVPGKWEHLARRTKVEQNMATQASRTTDVSTMAVSSIATVRVVDGSQACVGCPVLVYDHASYKGAYTTDNFGYVKLTGTQYSSTKPYFVIAGKVTADHSCDAWDGIKWVFNHTYAAKLGFAVRRASQSSLTIDVVLRPGISNARYRMLAYRASSFSSPEYPNVTTPFGFENFLGSSGYTVKLPFEGPYDNPDQMCSDETQTQCGQLHANYHVFHIDPVNPKLWDQLTFTWQTTGKSVAGWTVRSCTEWENDPYPDCPKLDQYGNPITAACIGTDLNIQQRVTLISNELLDIRYEKFGFNVRK
ncbi:MAG: hypothetical protein HYV63_14655 [Candidatus Schekmanbacteria bacterium]|nr:hypothetical protein [Candidatus Schekmanbacteria bacterium]